MLTPNLFNTILIFPTINILLFFYHLFILLRIPFAFGFSIISLTVLIRGLLHPFFSQQTQMAKKMEELKPHLDHLSKKHKDDKKRLQEEQLKLYKQKGINPATGCLFALIQMPIFIALYNVLSIFLVNGGISKTKVVDQINKIIYADFLKINSIDPWFFGFNLGVAPSQYQKFGVFYLLIPVITAILQYYQSSIMTPKTVNNKQQQNTKDKKDDSGDMQKVMSTQMRFMFPLMIGIFSYQLPIGMSLYWNIFSIFSIIQYRKLKVNPQAGG